MPPPETTRPDKSNVATEIRGARPQPRASADKAKPGVHKPAIRADTDKCNGVTRPPSSAQLTFGIKTETTRPDKSNVATEIRGARPQPRASADKAKPGVHKPAIRADTDKCNGVTRPPSSAQLTFGIKTETTRPDKSNVATEIRGARPQPRASADKAKPGVHKPAIRADTDKCNGVTRPPSSAQLTFGIKTATRSARLPVVRLAALWLESSTPWRASAPPPPADMPRPAPPPRAPSTTTENNAIPRPTARETWQQRAGSPVTSRDVASTYDVCVLAVNTQNPRTQHARRIYAFAPHAGGAVGGRVSGDSPLPSRSDSRPPKDESLTDSPPSLVSLSRPEESPDPTRRVAAEAYATRRRQGGRLRGIVATPSTSTKDPNKSSDANRSRALVIFCEAPAARILYHL
ncbi:uncharacterized protein LOC134780624 [Penaeus indicus]|uniref:uncharacterized protein LOC134780624 n=1 Tax=Penaeus indicus TaxID=29960 RepID=UPI00300D1D6B